MATSGLLRLLLRCRSPFVETRRRALDEVGRLDPDTMSLDDLGAFVTFIPDLIDAGGLEAGRIALTLLQRDLGGLSASRFERIYPYLPVDLGPLVVGALARQRRPESWLALRRVLHLELIQPQHAAPEPGVLAALGDVCHEPTFALDAVLEALDDPLWTVEAARVLVAWTERRALSEPDLVRCKEKVPLLEEMLVKARAAAVGPTA